MPKVTQPDLTDRNRDVENVYRRWFGLRDFRSRRRTEQFLEDRYRPDKVSTYGGMVMVWRGDRYRTKLVHDGWLQTWPRYFGTLLLANVIVNSIINAPLIGTAINQGVDALKDRWSSSSNDNIPPQPPFVIDPPVPVDIGTPQTNAVSDSQPDIGLAMDLANDIEAALVQDRTVDLVEIFGRTSDEWTSNPGAGLGVADDENTELGRSRAARYAEVLRGILSDRGIDVPIELRTEERVLSEPELALLDRLATQAGFNDLEDAVDAYAEGEIDPPSNLADAFERYLAQERGVRIEVTSSTPDLPEPAPAPSPPADRPYDPSFFPVPWIPIPRFLRMITSAPTASYLPTPGKKEREFVLVHPKGVDRIGNDKQLVKVDWRYVRKYLNLIRESDRIQTLQTLNFVDANGLSQSLRVMFIDHVPTPETVEAFSQILKKASLMQGGRPGEHIDTIAVYPSDNAGRHREYKKVGLGLDVQYDKGVLGVTYPSFNLIELHMDPRPTPEALASMEGSVWTGLHEVGHVTDTNDRPNRLEYVGRGLSVHGKRIVKYYETSARFTDAGEAEYDRSMRALKAGKAPTWQIRTFAQTPTGRLAPITQDVGNNDPRLGRAERANKRGFLTDYSMTSAGEAYAEVVANMASRIGVPWEHAEATGPKPTQPEPGYADTFHASPEMRRVVHAHLGSDPDHDVLHFADPTGIAKSWKETIGPPEIDFEFSRAMNEARKAPMLRPDDMVHLLTETRYSHNTPTAEAGISL